jgi:RNA polymerase sigma factor (sigma-70 family)
MTGERAMIDDQHLLRRYATEGDEAAFGELVARHVDLVYSVALREVGTDAHLAQDVAQLVFVDLARKARWLSCNIVLAGWLHRATRYAARQTLRSERRRRAREQHAVVMNETTSHSEADWQQIRPVLDDALDRLNRADRDALVLRYFSQRSLAEVGATLGTNEDAARKRISRALAKLRTLLARRGVTTSAAALAATLAANAVQGAPAGLAVTLTSASLAGTATASVGTLTILKLIIMSKIKVSVISAVVIASVATPLMLQHQSRAHLRDENNSLRLQLAQLEQQTSPLPQPLASEPIADEQFRELLRLRSEVGQLRKQTNDLEKLRGENRQLRASLTSRPSNTTEPPPAVDFPRETWAFAGYAEPTSAFQSLLWSSTKGDMATALASVTPERRAMMEKDWANKSEAEISAGMVQDTQHTRNFRVLGQQVVGNDEVILQVYVVGEKRPETVMLRDARMRNINGEWKFDGWAKKPGPPAYE